MRLNTRTLSSSSTSPVARPTSRPPDARESQRLPGLRRAPRSPQARSRSFARWGDQLAEQLIKVGCLLCGEARADRALDGARVNGPHPPARHLASGGDRESLAPTVVLAGASLDEAGAPNSRRDDEVGS